MDDRCPTQKEMLEQRIDGLYSRYQRTEDEKDGAQLRSYLGLYFKMYGKVYDCRTGEEGTNDEV